MEAVRLFPAGTIELILIGLMDEEFQSLWNRLRGDAKWLRGLARSDLAHYYRSADLLVLPSVCDSFGQVALEAMACGTPVIITSACGAPVRDGIDGFVVPPRDTHALRHAIRTALGERDALAELGQNASQHACEFTWDRFHHHMVQLFETIRRQ